MAYEARLLLYIQYYCSIMPFRSSMYGAVDLDSA